MRSKRFRCALNLLVLASLTLSLMPGAWAKPKFKVLAGIPGGLWSGLTFDSKGNLYGVTTGGGDYGVGSIFEMTLNSKGKWSVTTLHSFDGTDGSEPNGGLIFDAEGNLYGTTPDGGVYDVGTVFKLTPGSAGWTLTVIDNFCPPYGCPDGGGPLAGLTQDKEGNLLGTARAGLYNMGVVFQLTPGSDGWNENVLYSFGSRPHDGSGPMDAPNFDAQGNIYGTTYRGGANDAGTVFGLERTASSVWEERLLYSFCPGGFPCKGGAGPTAGIALGRSGDIYGTTAGGGAACKGDFCGTVFRLARDKRGQWIHSILYGFLKPEEGFEPITGVVLDKSGNLYGTTAVGGVGACYDGCGVVYKLSPGAGRKWKYTVLHKFSSQAQSPPDGALILDAKGNLYGTAFSIVYEITP
jgi:uncharacterized repeat protein (TIGR03803 family)